MTAQYANALQRATEDEIENLIASLSKYGQNRKQALDLICKAVDKVAASPPDAGHDD